jgi:tetratricopeptide (TPR) repeat protein
MTGPGRACVMTILTLTLAALPVHAQLTDEDLAKGHYERGEAAYAGARYEAALVEFEEAYRLSHRPALQYNLAVCHERLSQLEGAITAYRSYLADTPDAPDRAGIEARVRELTARRNAQLAPSPAPLATKEAPRPRRRGWIWGVVGGAVGAAVVATVIAVAVTSTSGSSVRDYPPLVLR